MGPIVVQPIIAPSQQRDPLPRLASRFHVGSRNIPCRLVVCPSDEAQPKRAARGELGAFSVSAPYAPSQLCHAHLPRLRLALSLHHRRCGALVPQPRRASRRGGPSRHLPDAASLARRRGRGGAGSRGRTSRAQARVLHRQRTEADRAGTSLRVGVLRHLSRAGARYDVVHTASFPYFSLLAAAQARRRHPFRIVVDWFEVWSSEYWREYLGPVKGRIGLAVQRRCIRIRQQAFCFSRLFARRLLEQGLRGDITVLEGIYAGPPGTPPEPAEPVVVFAGRHIPEKQATALVPAIARARTSVPGLRGRSSATARPDPNCCA